ncbi:MAG: hypothetical protein GWO16_03850 [Gammaproteobacteria bacterium]|nr:hypothetical protein [Gammaproteobacteria bacterium]NIR28841.1 hypothetical protein [Gammaproteobacteria bacterium]NIR97222.1 hypothetical protein [Gammaproteobacteria bacterium]NIT62933.1 hypothetical protein [Gammaproteobacteria bacterium]NIV20623.1 hypothetical protein [Gammaproteobacteria bacterium]
MSIRDQMSKLIDSRYRLAAFETNEPDRIVDVFRGISRDTGKAIYYWENGLGMYRLGSDHILIPETARPRDALSYIASASHFAIYLLRDLSDALLDSPKLVQQLTPIVEGKVAGDRRLVVLLGEDIRIPRGLKHNAVRVRHKLNAA